MSDWLLVLDDGTPKNDKRILHVAILTVNPAVPKG